MSPPPAVTLTTPPSPSRARSVSQPIREDFASDFSPVNVSSLLRPAASGMHRSHSSGSVQSVAVGSPMHGVGDVNAAANAKAAKGRARSSSLVTVTEVGGDEPENVVDRLGVGSNENAAWVNAPGVSSSPLFLVSKRQWLTPMFRRLVDSSNSDPSCQSAHRCGPWDDARSQLDHRQPRLYGSEFYRLGFG